MFYTVYSLISTSTILKMKQNESLLSEALAITGIGCWEWDLQSKSLTCTDQVYRLFGLEIYANETGYQHFFALVHQKDQLLISKAIGQALQARKLTRVGFNVTRPDGTVCTLEASGQVREDESGKAIKLMGTLQDITAYNQTSKAILKSEKQYHFIAEAVPAMIWSGYSEQKRDYVNTWMVNYTGLPPEKLLGEEWLDTIHPDDRQATIDAQANALQTRQPYHLEVRFKRADGSYRWHIMHALPFREEEASQTKWIGVNVDIHEQKLKEIALQENKALREAQQKLKAEHEFSESILENSINGILAFDKSGQITRWNKQMEFLSGKEREDVLGKTLLELFPQYTEKEEGKAIKRALRGEKVTLRKHNNPFGFEERLYEINLLPLKADGEIIGGLAIIYEVTEIIKLEQAQTDLKLEQQKEILNTILRAQERERERISESLHNGIAQMLFAIKLNLQMLNTKNLQLQIQEVMAKVNDLLNEAIRQSRTVSFELVPTILKDFGLKVTLEDFVKTLSSPALAVSLQVAGIESKLEKFFELTVFRISQALLSNVLEHSEATEASLSVFMERNNLVVRVRDNGKGFVPETATATIKENSLQTVRNRAVLLNGRVTIDSAIDKGTTVTVTLPIPKKS